MLKFMSCFKIKRLLDEYSGERIKHEGDLEKFVFTIQFFVKYMFNLVSKLCLDISSIKKEDKSLILWFLKLIQYEREYSQYQLKIDNEDEFLLKIWNRDSITPECCKKYLQIESFILMYRDEIFNTMNKKNKKKRK